MDPAFLTVTEQSALIAAGALDPLAQTERYLSRIAALDGALRCYVTLARESARAEAAAAQARASAGARRSALDGIVIALKDNIDAAGLPTSNGFGGAPWRVPAADAPAVRRLRDAGAVILGKLNMEEAALGGVTDNPHFGRTENPHRPGFTAGGSSGGSAAAVAGGLCAAALGTDTGGSVRIPAAYCGIVGLKPTRDLIPLEGVVLLSRRLDHVGLLTRSVGDAALLLAALGDPAPPARAQPPAAPPAPRLAVLTNFAREAVEPGVAAAFSAALRLLRQAGAAIEEVALPSYDPVVGRRAGFLQAEIEAAAIHGALARAQPERLSERLRRYLDYGARVGAEERHAIEQRIARGASELSAVLARFDAILSPATPQAAFPFGPAPPENQASFAVLANFAGAPAISLPMGRDDAGLPLGLQIMAAPGRDVPLLALAADYESRAQWRIMPPPPYGP